MADTTTTTEKKAVEVKPQSKATKPAADTKGRDNRGKDRRPRRRRPEREPREFDQQILDLTRVTRVTAGGKRMRFRVALVIGDKKGRVGFGVAKGTDVQLAIQKAFHQAKRHMITLNLVEGTFPHKNAGKFGAADVLIMPAPKGTGLKSGGAVRVILELAGVSDAVSKILGSKNKVNIAKATFNALETMVVPDGILTDADNAIKSRKAKRTDAVRKVTKSGGAKTSTTKKPAPKKEVKSTK